MRGNRYPISKGMGFLEDDMPNLPRVTRRGNPYCTTKKTVAGFGQTVPKRWVLVRNAN